MVDACSGDKLSKTAAPGNDAFQARSWDVSSLRGREVRIEVHDGNSGGAFAWPGVGSIDAGPAMRIDFRDGMPTDWKRPEDKASMRYDMVTPGVPFQRNAAVFGLIPRAWTS